jgi:catechol 2,3-dioxygenase-like lactoylglutathione lyase family enzyme
MSSLFLHHINLSSTAVAQMDEFYREVLGIDALKGGTGSNRMMTSDGYTAPVSFLKSNGIELHLATTDRDLNFRIPHAINPLITGHIAFRTDDLAAVKRCLEEKGIKYSDYGIWSINDWHQIFFHDPAGNVVEVHQVMGK